MGSIKNISEKTSVSSNVAHQMPAAPSYERSNHYEDDTVELDAIERLKSNILMLDDLQKRLGFMNQEIEQILGTRKK